jgi:hypothetical protein
MPFVARLSGKIKDGNRPLDEQAYLDRAALQ